MLFCDSITKAIIYTVLCKGLCLHKRQNLSSIPPSPLLLVIQGTLESPFSYTDVSNSNSMPFFYPFSCAWFSGFLEATPVPIGLFFFFNFTDDSSIILMVLWSESESLSDFYQGSAIYRSYGMDKG